MLTGVDALWGHLPTIDDALRFQTARGVVAPVEPAHYPSAAPVAGTGTVYAFARPGDVTTITLSVFDDEPGDLELTLSAMPSNGQVYADATMSRALSVGDTVPTFVLHYVGGEEPGRNDTLRLLARNEQTMVEVDFGVIVLFSLVPDPPAITRLDVVEDLPNYIALSSVLFDGRASEVVIEALPSIGVLAQVDFAADSVPTYASLVYDQSSARWITTMNDTVTDPRGIVVYYPRKDDNRADTFTYRYRDPASGELSASAGLVEIIVQAANDAPEATNVHISTPSGRAVTIQLEATDNDGSFAPSPNATITRLPTLGTLYQYQDGSRGAPISLQRLPTVSSFATQVVRFSSQFSLCGVACYEWASPQCPSGDNGNAFQSVTGFEERAEVWGSGTCRETAWHASAILGPPDVYPSYADDKNGYDLSTEGYGREFIELRFFRDEFYVSAIEIYETFKPGAVIEVAVTDNYQDNNSEPCFRDTCSERTSWTVLWSGEPDTGLPEDSRVFAPSLCFTPVKAQVVRLVMDTAAVPGWNNYDAVALYGLESPAPGAVFQSASGANVVEYVPSVGFHGVESFEFDATDCIDTSNDVALVTIAVEAPNVTLGQFTSRPPSRLPPFHVTAHVSDSDATPYDAAVETITVKDWPESVMNNIAGATLELRATTPGVTVKLKDTAANFNVGDFVSLSSVLRDGEMRFQIEVAEADATEFSREIALAAYSSDSLSSNASSADLPDRLTRAFEFWVHDGLNGTYRNMAISCWSGLLVLLRTDTVPSQFRGLCLVCHALAGADWFDPAQLADDNLASYLASCGQDGDSVVNCPAGSYFEAALFRCRSCPVGTFTNTSGRTECEPCPTGSAQPVAGSKNCALCDAFSYSDQPGAESCTSCPPNTVVRGGSTGSSELRDCIPVPGTYSRSWPVPISGAVDCPSGATCEVGFVVVAVAVVVTKVARRVD